MYQPGEVHIPLGKGYFLEDMYRPIVWRASEKCRVQWVRKCGPLQKSLRRRQYDLSLSLRCQFVYWHCPRNKRSWVYVTVWRPSVRPSVLPSVCRVIRRQQRLWHSAATAPQHGAQQQMLAVSCWQPSWRGWTQACFNYNRERQCAKSYNK